MSNKLSLQNVTLVSVDCINYGKAIGSLMKSMDKCSFGSVKFLTDIDISVDGIDIVKIPKIKSLQEYSLFIIKELNKYFDTEYVLITQHDSWVLNQDAWDEEYFKFDVLGASWGYKDGRNTGQGGFCLHSKRLHEIISTDEKIEITFPDDEILARLYRGYLEKKGIVYATEEVANKFSFELNEPTQHTFGFHSYFHKPFKEHIVIKRSGATGDIIMMEPVIDFYCKKNYQVVLDIPEQIMRLFFQYPYPLKHISQMNSKIVPQRTIELDMAYEINPKQLALSSYYEMAGITDGEYRNSRLYMYQEPHQKIFQKYILIHNDNTNLPHRNSYGVNWNLVVAHFQKLGYLVFQVGNNPREIIAPHYNCPTLDMLLFMVKGADLVIGIDSGISQMSVALGTPTVILSGSVDLTLRYIDFEKIGVVQEECPDIKNKFCYHSTCGTTGSECIYDKERPPCCIHSEFSIIKEANKLLNH